MAIKMRGYGFDTVGRCVLTLLRVLSYLHSGADTSPFLSLPCCFFYPSLRYVECPQDGA